jgi:hypothetical protein
VANGASLDLEHKSIRTRPLVSSTKMGVFGWDKQVDARLRISHGSSWVGTTMFNLSEMRSGQTRRSDFCTLCERLVWQFTERGVQW